MRVRNISPWRRDGVLMKVSIRASNTELVLMDPVQKYMLEGCWESRTLMVLLMIDDTCVREEQEVVPSLLT